jgi:glutamate dehydrogenase
MRLVAAFNHQHIFLDPDPDAPRSFVERRRLFQRARSGWDDYDRKLLSRGGGIFDRHAKIITLAPEARRLLGLETAAAAPQEVIRRILCLPVDLLWNGGIGTYVKASTESHADVGDRANDAVRVDAARLGARAVAEGGNLGFSQAGRIEYARHGGRINTDFVDNSGGVNCSDLEVNIKIALDTPLRRRRLTRPARDRLLARMAPDVATLVLRNNYLQSQAISVLQRSGPQRFGELAHLITLLERNAGLDRRLEGLPDEEELAQRRRQGDGFTRPEIATLLSWSRIWLNEQLLQSDVPEDPYLARELVRCFPEPMRRRFAREIAEHRLRRELIATATTSSLVNRMGPSFVPRAVEDTGASAGTVARASTIAREITGMRALWAAIEAQDGLLPAAQQYAMMQRTSDVLAQLAHWFLERRRAALDIERAVAAFGPGLRRFLAQAPALLTGIEAERLAGAARELREGGVPQDLAATVAALPLARSGIDVVDVATATRLPIRQASRLYLDLGTVTGLDWIRQQIDALPVERHFQSLARGALYEEACALQRRLCERVLQRSAGGDSAAALARWRERRRDALQALARSQASMRAAPVDFPTLSVALAAVRRLADG